MTDTSKPFTLNRRSFLKGSTAAAAGLAVGGSVTGFPYISGARAEEARTLRYLGTAVNQSQDIASQVKKDLGITIEYVPVTTDEVTKRIITQPNTFDIVDTEYFSLKKFVPTGNLMGMDATRIKEFDNITSVFTKGEIDGKPIGNQGTAPWKVLYLTGNKSKEFSPTPTQWITLIPTTYNADTLGIRPDLIGRPINSWAELLNPEFKGRAAILNIPSIGIMDAAMVIEAMGKHKYADKGNM
ncbi:twin-arginine translocation signal domain-containing protein, partial [Pseudoxanthobacter sp.]|uniref:twin-arginine translocation signal domain-containing protein n=1 Tax=Pseudoxanthobacter sp. TaxID=1925742 RepID=UPI002FE15302